MSLLKEAERKAEEEKRDQILEKKQTKQQVLLDTIEQISLHRTALGKAALLKLVHINEVSSKGIQYNNRYTKCV